MKFVKDLDVTTQKSKPSKPIRFKEKYIVISLNMVDVNAQIAIVVKLQHLKKGHYIFKTPQEIIQDHKFAFSLSKKDLMQVSYLAGFHQVTY